MGGPAFYVSYAWDQEGQDGFVDQVLKPLCSQQEWQGLELRQDVNRVDVGDSLKAFVQEIGESGCVVAVLSDPYFRSFWCMSELLAVHQNGGLKGRLIPVNLSKVDFNDPQTWDEILAHWADEVQKAQFDSRQYGVAPVAGRAKLRDEVAAIYQNIDPLMDFLRTRLAATQATDAPKVLAKVEEYLRILPDAPPPRLPPPIAGAEGFAGLLERRLADKLGKGQGERIQEALRGLLEEKRIKNEPAPWLASAAEPLEAARLLRRAVKGLLEAEPAQAKALWEVAERLFGLVALRVVRPEWVQAHRAALERGEEPPLRFRLVSDAAVEILVSRLHPELKDVPLFEWKRGKEVKGCKRFNNRLRNESRAGAVIDHGVRDDFVQETLRNLWQEITPEGRRGGEPPADIKDLREELQDHLGYRHEDGDAPYLAIDADDRANRLNEQEIQRQLRRDLPSLRMIFLSSQEGDGWDRLLLLNKQSSLITLLTEFLSLMEPKP
jgi:hypothetical protein